MRMPFLLPAMLLLPTTGLAANGGFVGPEFGRFAHTLTEETENANQSETDRRDGGALNLKAGMVSTGWRSYVTLHIPETEADDDNLSWITGSWDYLFLRGRALQPYAGFQVGYYRFTRDPEGRAQRAVATTVGPEFGVQVTAGDLLFDLNGRVGVGVDHEDNIDGRDLLLDWAGSISLGASVLF